VTAVSTVDEEPPGLHSFVGALRLLEPVRSELPALDPWERRPEEAPGAVLGPIVGYFVVWLLVLGTAKLIAGARRSQTALPEAIAAATIAIIWVVDMALMIYLMKLRNVSDPFQQGTLFAQPFVHGFATNLVAFLVWVTRRGRLAAAASARVSPGEP
jgi:hypothetical protein